MSTRLTIGIIIFVPVILATLNLNIMPLKGWMNSSSYYSDRNESKSVSFRSNWKREKRQAPPECSTLEFEDHSLMIGGKELSLSLSPPDTNFDWYEAVCCCRSRGQHLYNPNNQQDLANLYTELQGHDAGTLGYIDINTFSGKWANLYTGKEITDNVWCEDGAKPSPKEETCMEISQADPSAETYNMCTISCDTKYKEQFVCAKGKDKCSASKCSKDTIIQFAKTRKCPTGKKKKIVPKKPGKKTGRRRKLVFMVDGRRQGAFMLGNSLRNAVKNTMGMQPMAPSNRRVSLRFRPVPIAWSQQSYGLSVVGIPKMSMMSTKKQKSVAIKTNAEFSKISTNPPASLPIKFIDQEKLKNVNGVKNFTMQSWELQ